MPYCIEAGNSTNTSCGYKFGHNDECQALLSGRCQSPWSVCRSPTSLRPCTAKHGCTTGTRQAMTMCMIMRVCKFVLISMHVFIASSEIRNSATSTINIWFPKSYYFQELWADSRPPPEVRASSVQRHLRWDYRGWEKQKPFEFGVGHRTWKLCKQSHVSWCAMNMFGLARGGESIDIFLIWPLNSGPETQAHQKLYLAASLVPCDELRALKRWLAKKKI